MTQTLDVTIGAPEAGDVTPGDEKAALPQAKGAPTPLSADAIQKADAAQSATKAPTAPSEPYAKKDATSTAQSGAGDANPGNQAKDKPVESDVIPTKGGGQNQ